MAYSFVIFFAVAGIVILPRKMHIAVKLLLMLGVAVIVFKFHVSSLFSGHKFIPLAQPWWLSLLFAGLFFSMFAFALLLLVAGSWRVIRKMRGNAWTTPRDKWVDLSLLGIAMLLAVWGVYNGSRPPVVKRCEVVIPGLPQEAKNIKLAVLTDIHADSRCTVSGMRRLVERTNALEPDVILILGDNMDGYINDNGGHLADVMKELQNLRAKYGVYGVSGNHEYYSGYREWNAFLLDHGIQMLENAHIDLPCHLSIAGVPDRYAEKCGEVVPDAERAIAGAKYPAILLSHEPIDAKKNAKHGFILQLSGHTHGGLFPGLRYYVNKHNDGFVSGWYDVEKMKLYVSEGTGIWGGLPIRFDTRAEITLITLK